MAEHGELQMGRTHRDGVGEQLKQCDQVWTAVSNTKERKLFIGHYCFHVTHKRKEERISREI